MSISPGKYSFTLYQGATFSRILTWKDANEDAINLTGYTARLQMRESVDADAPFATLTTENGGITLGGAAGTIMLGLSAADSEDIEALSGVYDLELVSAGGVVTRLLEGEVTISREVTR